MRIDIGYAGRVVLLFVLGLATALEIPPGLAAPPMAKFDEPKDLAEVAVPHPLSCLCWSPDNAFLAAGGWGWLPVGTQQNTSEILIVDVAQASIKTTLKVSAVVSGLAFSPDGKWLVVGTSPSRYAGDASGELVLFNVPEFTRKFTAKPSQSNAGFSDFAWNANGKALCVIERSTDSKSQVRRWAVPEFTEQPALVSPMSPRYRSLAQSPDDKTLAVGDDDRVVRLFDLKSGAERNSFKTGLQLDRLGFAADSGTIAVIEYDRLTWHEAQTGKLAKPNPGRLVVPLAGLSDPHRSCYAVSLDGNKLVSASERHPTIVFQEYSKAEHGAHVVIRDHSSGKTWNWRVGETKGTGDTPVLAISSDCTKLAGTVLRARGNAIAIWPVPK